MSGLDFANDSRAFAAADIDNDGNLHVVLKSRLSPQIRVLQNDCSVDKRSIALRLRGTKSNRDAIEAGQNRAAEERAISIRSDHTGAINNLGVLYGELGQSNDAIAAFRSGIEIAPENEELYLNLRRLYTKMGEGEKARDTMRQLLEKKPGSLVARRALQELESR